ncbi:HAD family hydrolase [Salininema proteolyticum]|uniref:HAD family hydrolase n=1 Tax=Salininema proteolyticum TaxID=1607685 RepID=A0ABV8U3A3_9ACTN
MLICFDIDGTLMRDTEDTPAIFTEALRPLLGFDPSAGDEEHGVTDLKEIRDLFTWNGLTESEANGRLPEAIEALGETTERHAAEIRAGRVLCPGAEAAVEKLAAESAALCLLTGNTRRRATVKLGDLPLARSLRVGGPGGYGESSVHRADLVALAWEECGAGEDEDMVLVGDTPADVAAAKLNGVGSVAVCTGAFGEGDLGAADVVLPDLAHPGAVESILGAARPFRL